MTDAPAPQPKRRRDLLAFLLFLLLPAVLLGESLFTADKYLPYDTAEFPPIAQTLDAETLKEIRSTANYDATEAPIWFAIELRLAREALRDGHLPHWNPYVRGGAPMLAHGHLGLLNPLHWPALVFPDPHDGLLYLTYVMFALAGVFMFGFLRAMQLSTAAAIFGGLAFAWSGTLTANGHWFMRMEPLAMLPGMLWAIVAIANRSGRERAWPAAGLAATTACTWLSGFPQYGIPVTLLAAAFGVVFIVRELQKGFRPGAALTMWLGAAGLLGVLLAMPQLLQMLHFYPQSNRPIAEPLDRATRHAFAPFGFLGYLLPDAFSHPSDATLPQAASPLPYLWSNLKHWDTGEQLLPNYNFTEYALFPGTMPLVLAVLALLVRGPRWRWFPIAALAGVWLLATGAFGVYHAYHLPGIKPVPPYRFGGPACALLAMLAAISLDSLRQRAQPWLLRIFALALIGGGIALIALAQNDRPGRTTAEDPWLVEIVDRYRDVYSRELNVQPQEVTPAAALKFKFSPNNRNRPDTRFDAISIARQRLNWNLRRGGIALLLGAGMLMLFSLQRREVGLRGWPTWIVVGFAAVELGLFSFHLNRGQALEHNEDTAVHAFLAAQRDAEADRGGFLVARGLSRHRAFNLPGGTLAADHIRDLNFYTFVDNKSDLPIRKMYDDAFILRGFVCDALPDDPRLERPWWDLMGLRYVLATQPMQHAGNRVGPERVGNADYYVYERPNALPRAWVVPTLRPIDDEGELVSALTSPTLDPRAAVFVSSADAMRLGRLAKSGPILPAARERQVTFEHEDKDSVTIRVAPGETGYLVVADTFFAGWEVTINGEPAELARGNLYQRVVPVPSAECTLEFRFRAEGFRSGLLIGDGAVVALILLLLAGAWPRRIQVGVNGNVPYVH